MTEGGRGSELYDLDAKTWGLLFAALFLISLWLCRRITACCLSSQRAKLRDEYEDELRRGGQMTNRLLLPVAHRTDWNPHGVPR